MPERHAKGEATDAAKMPAGVIEVLNALGGKHGEMDLQLKSVTLELVGTPVSIRLNGFVTVNVRLSEISDREKQALEEASVTALGR